MRNQVLGHTMIQLLGIKKLGQPAKVGFNQKAFIPAAAFTMLEVARLGTAFTQALVGLGDGSPIVA